MSPKNRDGGFTFELDETDSTHTTSQENLHRQSKTFAIDEQTPETIPDSITANERLPNVSQFSLFKLEALPIKGLKVFFYFALILVVVLSLFEIIRVFNYAMSIHFAAAYAFSALLFIVALLGIRVVYRYFKDTENLAKLSGIQDKADRLLEGNDFGQAEKFIAELHQFYKHKPQQEYFARCIKDMPDYSNDREAIKHIDEVFLKPIDDEAIRRISNYCVQTGVTVAISPWASLDMLLSLWRSSKMINDVAQVYGLRPSLPNRLRLLRQVLHQLLFVGATELATESILAEFGFQGVTSSLSARAGQGIGAGFYTAKIGIAAMKVTRPIAFNAKNKPKLSLVASEMVAKIKSIFFKKPAA